MPSVKRPGRKKKGNPGAVPPSTALTVSPPATKRVNGTLFTPEVELKILYAAYLGLSNRMIAAYAGINRMTFQNWLKHDLEGTDARYHGLNDRIEEAKAKGAAENVEVIYTAGKRGEWQASVKALQLLHGYSEKRDVEVKGKVDHGGQIVVVPQVKTPQDWIAEQQQRNLERKAPDSLEIDIIEAEEVEEVEVEVL